MHEPDCDSLLLSRFDGGQEVTVAREEGDMGDLLFRRQTGDVQAIIRSTRFCWKMGLPWASSPRCMRRPSRIL